MSNIFPPPTLPIRTATGVAVDRSIRHFNQVDLSRRWNLSERTLERWRWRKQGPRYLKIGGRVVYRLEDIEAFETAQTKNADQISAGASK